MTNRIIPEHGFVYPKGHSILEDWEISYTDGDKKVVTYYLCMSKVFETAIILNKKVLLKVQSPTKEHAIRIHETASQLVTIGELSD
jgi:hypothetical protein